jgi:4-hydroxybutyrate CoA-transferase
VTHLTMPVAHGHSPSDGEGFQLKEEGVRAAGRWVAPWGTLGAEMMGLDRTDRGVRMSMSWELDYKSKLQTADEALRCVESGMRVYIQPGCAEPETLVEALMRRGPFVGDVEVVHMLTMGAAPYVAPEMAGHFRHNAVFIGANVRQAINEGRADYTPIYLSEIEELFESGAMPIDVALLELSPPDSHGFCSFGVGVDTSLTAAKCAKYVVAQINDQMPRTYGDSFIHVTDLDAIVDSSRPLCAMKPPQITVMHRAIASYVAGLIEDGAVLQTGIGGIPDAVLPLLMDRKDLGVHSELVSDGVIPLIEAGVLTGARKNYKPRKIILGFALGTKQLFNFLDNNPIFEFHPTSYTNDPGLIARNDNMVAINSALQVDLTGQVCSDSIGNHFYSGIGGQVDFIRGASRSKGGKPIIAISSTAKNGAISRIVPMLSPGAGVVTSRGLIRYVVTEYGVAYLHGKSIRERAQALINIAHPKFREELYEYCEKTRWLQRPLVVSESDFQIQPIHGL